MVLLSCDVLSRPLFESPAYPRTAFLSIQHDGPSNWRRRPQA